MSKVCERVALDQFSAYLMANHRLSPHQNRNKKFHSTETLNLFVIDTILEAIDEKNFTTLILLDMSKAFDSVTHPILLLHIILNMLALLRKPLNGLRATCQEEDNMYVLDPLSQQPSLRLMACHRVPFYYHYCFVFIQMICRRSHYQAILIPTSTIQNFL